MPFIRVELDTTPERAKKFHQRVQAGAPFTREKHQALDDAWSQGRTPTGVVHYRGVGNTHPPTLKFDVEVSLEVEH